MAWARQHWYIGAFLAAEVFWVLLLLLLLRARKGQPDPVPGVREPIRGWRLIEVLLVFYHFPVILLSSIRGRTNQAPARRRGGRLLWRRGIPEDDSGDVALRRDCFHLRRVDMVQDGLGPRRKLGAVQVLLGATDPPEGGEQEQGGETSEPQQQEPVPAGAAVARGRLSVAPQIKPAAEPPFLLPDQRA
jgi:hypothetical protein